jgi:hypothetical protein
MITGLEWDPKVSIEGTATALGVMGAAVGYLISLVQRSRQERMSTFSRGTRLLILDILEQSPWEGMSEDALWDAYNLESKKRRYYKASPPQNLTRIGFEREIRQLQLQFLIDLCGKDQYRVRMNPVTRYDADKFSDKKAMEVVNASVSRNEIIQASLKVLHSNERPYEKRNALKILIKLGYEDIHKEIQTILQHAEEGTFMDVISEIAEYIS